jgi:hypothetical protein
MRGVRARTAHPLEVRMPKTEEAKKKSVSVKID